MNYELIHDVWLRRLDRELDAEFEREKMAELERQQWLIEQAIRYERFRRRLPWLAAGIMALVILGGAWLVREWGR